MQITGTENNADTSNALYVYDQNGNMIFDGLKNLQISYNFLNLPSVVTQDDTPVAEYSWFADGSKYRVLTQQNNGYIYTGSLIYASNNGNLQIESTDFAGGRINLVQTGSAASGTNNTGSTLTQDIHYFHTDHLGSVRAITDNSGSVIEHSIQSAAFYSSREIKQMDKENTIKLSGSKMAGVLLTPNNAYITYNSRKELLDLDYRYEQRCHTLVSDTLCNNLPNLQYEPENICGLMFANNLSVIRHILYTENTNLRDFFLLDGDYHHFYYLTTDHHGEIMLRLIASPSKQDFLNRILRQDLISSKTIVPFDCDGIDRNGVPVLFGYFLDFPRINRFSTSLRLHKRKGIVICFDFQQRLLSEFLDRRITLQAISFEKFERSFFPSKNTNS